jgi:hypothetical protein
MRLHGHLWARARPRTFAPMAPLRRLLVALALCAVPSLACGGPANMEKLEAPASGVTLAYDLTPGLVYRGKVISKETVQGTSGNKISRGFSFDVSLAIRGPATNEHGGTMVTARYSNVDIKWGLPPGATFSIQELVSKATSQLQGLEVDFNVDETGKVLHMPELPPDMPEDLRYVLQEAINTLETAFLPAPQRPLKQGDTWKDDKTRGRKGKLGRYLESQVTTKVDGFFRETAAKVDLTRLTISESEKEITTAKTGSHEVAKETLTTAYFAHGDRYLHKLVRDQKIFDPGNSTTFAGLEVTWIKGPAVAAAPPEAVKQTQDISDPCHPDYVGAEECQAAGAAPAGDAAPTAPPTATAGEPVPANPPAPK